MTKKILSIFVLLILTSCGFSPIYTKSNKADYAINISEMNGDRLVNSLISSEINRITNSKSNVKYKIKINTSYEKLILSKNIKGSISEYQIIVKTTFNIERNNANKYISFEEKQNIKNTSNTFEQKNYENIIKKNFAVSMVRKLNLELLSVK